MTWNQWTTHLTEEEEYKCLYATSLKSINLDSQSKMYQMQASMIRENVRWGIILCQNKMDGKSPLVPKSKYINSGDVFTRALKP